MFCLNVSHPLRRLFKTQSTKNEKNWVQKISYRFFSMIVSNILRSLPGALWKIFLEVKKSCYFWFSRNFLHIFLLLSRVRLKEIFKKFYVKDKKKLTLPNYFWEQIFEQLFKNFGVCTKGVWMIFLIVRSISVMKGTL